MVPRETVGFIFLRVSENIGSLWKIKQTSFPCDHTLSALMAKTCCCIWLVGNNCVIISFLDHTFEFYQGHVTKNQPITVLILLSESLGI